jgi:hypothetical protein
MRANGWFRCVACAATAAFVWTIAVSASPVLHQRIHPDKSRADHSCAVIFVRSGTCHHVAAAGVSSVVNLGNEFTTLAEISAQPVPSAFLSAAIFEHAPPFES